MIEHHMAKALYARYKAGSRTMTTYEAYNIGNELDRQANRIVELEEALELARRTIADGAAQAAEIAREVKASFESLGKAVL